MADETKGRRPVPSIVGAAAVLRHLAQMPRKTGVNPIARATGLSPSSCFNILKTLVAEAFVTFDPADRSYTLGPELIRLARHAISPAGTAAILRPMLARFGREGLASAIWQIRSDRLLLTDFLDSDAATRIHMTVGHRLPLFSGAMGRAIAARLDLEREALHAAFDAIRWGEKPDFDTYVAQVEEARQRGWSIDEGQFIRGVTTVAAVIVDESQPRLCISNSFFLGSLDAAQRDAIGKTTAAVARDASARLFGVPTSSS